MYNKGSKSICTREFSEIICFLWMDLGEYKKISPNFLPLIKILIYANIPLISIQIFDAKSKSGPF